MTELIVLYKTPNDPEHFDKYYREVHGPMTGNLPGLKGCKYGPARALDGGTGAITVEDVQAGKEAT